MVTKTLECSHMLLFPSFVHAMRTLSGIIDLVSNIVGIIPGTWMFKEANESCNWISDKVSPDVNVESRNYMATIKTTDLIFQL